jgi:hypothetical protein
MNIWGYMIRSWFSKLKKPTRAPHETDIQVNIVPAIKRFIVKKKSKPKKPPKM